MKNQDFKTKLLNQIDKHCTKEEKETLLSMFSDIEKQTRDISILPQLYEEFHLLYEKSSYDYQNFFLNVRKIKDLHLYYIYCSDIQYNDEIKKTKLIQRTFCRIRDLIITNASIDNTNNEAILFGYKIDVCNLALDLAKSVYGALLRMEDAKENAKFCYELMQFSNIINAKESPVEVRFIFNNSELNQKFTSLKFLTLLNSDFASFFSLRIHKDLRAQYETSKEIALNLDVVLLYKIASVLFRYNLLPSGETYNLGDGISFSLGRKQVYFITSILEVLYDGPLHDKDGNIVEGADEKNSYVRKRLKRGKPKYDKIIDDAPPKMFFVEEDNTVIVIK